MREIMLFVEDFAHQQIIGALLQRFGRDLGIEMHLTWRSPCLTFCPVSH